MPKIISGFMTFLKALWDNDRDTGIQVEKTSDDDTIRFDLGGTTPIADVLKVNQASGFVWNDAGDNLNVRMESDDDANIINVSGASDSVAFGTANHSLPINGATVIPKVHILDGAGDANTSFVVRSSTATATQGAFMIAARSRGSDGAETVVVDGDRGLVFRSDMHDGTEYITAASINAVVDGTPSTGVVGGKWEFNTNNGAGGGNTAKMVLRADGKLGIGTSAPFTLLDVRGDSLFNFGKADADFSVWGTVALAIWHDAGNKRTRFGQNATGDVLELWATKTEFNRINADVDFQVRTSGSNATLFVDGGTDRVGVRTSTPASSLDVVGSISLPYTTKTGTYTITEFDHTINCLSGTFTVNLPTAVGTTGRIYNIKNSGTGTITLDGNGSQTIDGAATASIGAGICLTIQSTGGNWIII